MPRLRVPQPGSHREDVIVDDRSGPQWTVEQTTSPSIELLLEDHDVVFDPAEPPAVDVEPEEQAVEPLENAPDDQATEPVETDPPEETVPLTTAVVDRSDVLPQTHTDEPSSLAGLFGFGEHQVSFVPEWTRDFDVEGETAWDSLPSLADVAVGGEELGGTGGSIQRLWDATEDHAIIVDPIEGPIEEAPARLLDNQTVRWSMVFAGIVAVLLLVWGVRQIGSQPERAAVAREVQYATAAGEIGGALLPVQAAVPLLTQGELAPADITQLTGALDTLDGAARSAAALASEPLPRSPIVGSSLPIDELVLPKSLLEQAAVQGLAIEQRIGDAIAYRLTFARAFQLPELPAQADLVEIGTIGGELSVAIAETEQVLSQLPDDGFFAGHRQASIDFVQRLRESQAAYFSALRAGDTSEAIDIRSMIERGVEELRGGLSDPLAGAAAWSEAQFAQLQDVLDEIEVLTGA